MSNRTFYPSQSYGFARVYCEFRFLSNNVTSPVLVFAGQAGTQNVWGVGGDVISSITYAATGVLTVLFMPRDGYNKVIYLSADVDDSAAYNDGSYATCGDIANEASATLGIQFKIRCRAATGTATAMASSRPISCIAAFRNSISSNPA
jgi:hypothetical protein